MNYRDAYSARTTIEDALSWLRSEDGWTLEDLRDLVNDAIDLIEEDEKES